MFNSRGFRNAVLVATVVVLATGGVWAAETARKTRRRATAGVLWAIPGESLLCMKINRFDGTLDSVNAFLKDVAPVDAKAALLSKLTGMLGGDDRLRGVNKRGTIAVFALPVQSDSPPAGPMGNMFIGALLPVTKYEKFVSANANVGEADEQGISAITANGKPAGLVTNFRRFALLCPPNGRGQLMQVKRMLNQRKRSLGASLDAETRKQAASSPVWVYLNVKQASPMIQPMVLGKLEQIKGQLEKAKEKGEELPMDPAAIAGIFDFYGGILKAVLEGTDNVTLAVAPSAEACSLTVGLKPVPDTMMAAAVGEPLGGNLDHMLGYLENGAMINLAGKVDHENLKATYVGLLKLVGKMVPGGMSEADAARLERLVTKEVDAMGDSMAFAFGFDGAGSTVFKGKTIIAVRDRAAYEQVIEEELKLVEEGFLADLYKGFGFTMDVEIDRDAGAYKGVQIHGAKVGFKFAGEGETSAGMSKMFETLFGDGLTYRWAFAKGNCTFAFGSNANEKIREWIDQVRVGGTRQIGSQTKNALAVLDNADQSDVVGTFNLVRYMQMVAGFMAATADVEVPQFDAATESNVAFAGRTTEAGNMVFQIVMPKQHLLETKSVVENVIKKIEQQMKDKQKKTTQAKNI
ncbi:MAG: hypothetical protein JSW59_13050 [Phycisphaerales bacterium]|nr:MAG: hypothetical protein JSW59_13050 [Phycisphaerales bacterium]